MKLAFEVFTLCGFPSQMSIKVINSCQLVRLHFNTAYLNKGKKVIGLSKAVVETVTEHNSNLILNMN